LWYSNSDLKKKTSAFLIAWKAIGDRLQAPSYLRRVDHYWYIRARNKKEDMGKYSFVNGSITDWNNVSEGAVGDFPR